MMQTYDKYKSSDIDWIGDIPEHWKVVPMTKYFESIIDYRGKTPTKSESGVFLVTARNIKNGEINYSLSQEFILEAEFEKTMQRGALEIGDVLFTTEAPLGEAANVDKTDVAVAQRVIKFRGKKDILNNYFLKNWILSEKFQQDLMSYATGSTALGIKGSKLFHLRLVLPPIEEQEAILEFINEKTSQIDKLIANKQRLIELLKEERTAVINQAVTRGINPHAKLKPSGIDWLGEIPEQSQVLPIKYIVSTKVTDGPHETPQILNDGVPFVSAESVKNGKIDFNFKRGFISEEQDLIYSRKCKPKRNDVFIVKSGSTTGKIAIVDFDDDFNVWSPLALVRTDESKAYSWFIYYALQSDYFQDQIKFSWSFGTQPNIGMNVIENLKVIIPYEPNEQKQIVEFIENAITKIDATVGKIEIEIELLQEYRTALISEVVTGKIKVI